MTTDAHPPVQFVRAISRIDAMALVVGTMIGSGIFIVSADILRQVNAPGLLLLVWAIAGLMTVAGALTYGELAGMYPRAGGQYVYLREGISPLFGYLYGWTLFAVIQTGTIAAVAVAFARFTAVFFPALTAETFLGFTLPLPSGPIEVGLSPQRVLAIVSIIVLTWINIRGVRTAALIQTSLTAIKAAALGALILLGLIIGRNAEAIAANFGANFWHGVDTPGSRRVAEIVKQKTGDVPNYLQACGYAVSQILIEGINKANSTDVPAVVKALEGLSYEGPTGTETIRSEDHQVVKDYYLMLGKAKSAMKDKNDLCDVIAATKALPPPEKTGCQMAASL